jgi:hypothetical protein
MTHQKTTKTEYFLSLIMTLFVAVVIVLAMFDIRI